MKAVHVDYQIQIGNVNDSFPWEYLKIVAGRIWNLEFKCVGLLSARFSKVIVWEIGRCSHEVAVLEFYA